MLKEDLAWPLMKNNILREDLDAAIELLRQDDPKLTQGEQVAAFEREWSDWLGVKHSVFVNSGSSANLITMAALKEVGGPRTEVILPAVTWSSDVASVLHAGLKPVFVDIDPRTLGADNGQVLAAITPNTRAVFLTHLLGFNALSRTLLAELRRLEIPLIEDACESHGAKFEEHKVGSFGAASNFSFYYAHHMSTVEGGMVSTNADGLYQTLRMLRSHGLVREMDDVSYRDHVAARYQDLNQEFVFGLAGFNVRSTEINAVIGRSQLKRLDANVKSRNDNFRRFLVGLDPDLYRTDYALEGCSNYALTLILKKPDAALMGRVEAALKAHGVEYRRGTSGGGNQLRQPYLRWRFPDSFHALFPNAEHLHFYGLYLGNCPGLEAWKIDKLCEILNSLGGA